MARQINGNAHLPAAYGLVFMPQVGDEANKRTDDGKAGHAALGGIVVIPW